MRWRVFVLLIALLSPLDVAGESADLPAVLYSRDATVRYPVWVAARGAFDRCGRLKGSHFENAGPQYLDPRESTGTFRETLGEIFWEPTGEECSVVEGPDSHGESSYSPGTLADLIRASRSIHVGRIVAMEQGFVGSKARSLLKVEDIDTVKGATPNELLVSYHYARLVTPTRKYCVGLVKPEVGARIILFATGSALDKDGVFWSGVNQTIVEQDHKAMFNFAPGSGEMNGASFDEVLLRVREIMAK